VIEITKCSKAGQRRHVAAWHSTGPNHELALVMTKERAGVMAEASVLPQRTEFQRVEMAQLSNELAHSGIDAGAIIEQ